MNLRQEARPGARTFQSAAICDGPLRTNQIRLHPVYSALVWAGMPARWSTTMARCFERDSWVFTKNRCVNATQPHHQSSNKYHYPPMAWSYQQLKVSLWHA